MTSRQQLDDIARAEKLPPLKCEVPSWGVEVYLSRPSGRLIEEYIDKEREAKGREIHEVHRYVVMHHLVDEDGQRLYGDSDEDYEAFCELESDGVVFLYRAVFNRDLAIKAAKGN